MLIVNGGTNAAVHRDMIAGRFQAISFSVASGAQQTGVASGFGANRAQLRFRPANDQASPQWTRNWTNATDDNIPWPVKLGGVGQAFVLDAGPGAYTLTGSAATLLSGRMLSADPGAYTITGFAADLSKGFFLILDAGSYNITGAAAELLSGRMLSADAGAYALTGAAADLARGFNLSADAGSYTLLGFDVSLTRGFLLSADAGAYIITGKVANLLWDEQGVGGVAAEEEFTLIKLGGNLFMTLSGKLKFRV